MKVYELPNETKAAFGYTHKVILDHTDLTDTDAAQTINLIPVVAGTAVKSAATRLVSVFDSSDAATITTTVEIGHNEATPDPNAFITSQELNPSGTEVFYTVNPSTTPFVFTEGTAASPKYVQAAFACTSGDSLADHNVGELEVFLEIVNVNAL
jgi:hypothetical protein